MRDWRPQTRKNVITPGCNHIGAENVTMIAVGFYSWLRKSPLSETFHAQLPVSAKSVRSLVGRRTEAFSCEKKPLAPRVRLCLLKNWQWTWQITRSFRESFVCGIWNTGLWNLKYSSRNPESRSGADPGFCLGGGALISFSTSTPINHIVFFWAEYQLY